MPAALALLLASLAPQAGVTRYDASLYAQGSTYGDPATAASVSALEVGPSLGLEYQDRTSTLAIAYSPKLVLVLDAPPPQYFSQGALSGSFRLDPTFRLSAVANGCYGTNDFRLQYALTCGAPALALAADAAPPPIPGISTIKYLGASAALGLESQPSASLAITATLLYLAHGGADAPTRSVLPLQRGPSVAAAMEWTASRDDVLATSLSSSYRAILREGPASGAPGLDANAWISQLVETWRRAVGRRGRLALGLGVGAARNALDPAGPAAWRTSVAAEVGFQQGFGREDEPAAPADGVERTGAAAQARSAAIRLSLGARVAPYVDFTSGLAYRRGEAFASLAWPLGADWRVDASASAGVALDGIQHDQLTGDSRLSATWFAAEWARLSAGLHGLWQEAGPDYPTSSFRQVGLFVRVTFSGTGRL